MSPWSITARPGTDVDLDAVLRLYRAVGWTAYTDQPEVLRAALDGSTHLVLAHDARPDGELVGLARVVSDGASVAYLQDLLVHPDHRRSGLGTALVESVMAPYAAVRQKVLLTDAEEGQRSFYRSLGWHEVGAPGEAGPAATLRAFVHGDP